MRTVPVLLLAALLSVPAALPAEQALDVPVPAGVELPDRHPWQKEDAVSPPARWGTNSSGERYARLDCPFSTLKDWRVYWDIRIKADLQNEDQIIVTMRCPDPEAVDTVIIYFKAGNGWYAMRSFGVSSNWHETVLETASASIEGSPSGWGKVERIRLAVLPALGRDTYVELSSIRARRGWPVEHIGTVGPFQGYNEAVREIRRISTGMDCRDDVNERLEKAGEIRREVLTAGDITKRSVQKRILEARRLMSEAYALIQTPASNEFRGFWAHNGDGIRSYGGKRAARWSEATFLSAKGTPCRVKKSFAW